MTNKYGPTLPISLETHAMKYLSPGENFDSMVYRLADVLSDYPEHREALKDIIGNQRFLPAGRIQSSVGAPRETTAFNCFVSAPIEDSMDGIMSALRESALTMKLGGGIGYDFSTLRPRGAHIKTLDSKSSGAVSFMGVFDAMCGTISSAGHRRGAQMGVLRVDHPDIEEFVLAKQNSSRLRNFNISVGVTDEFMHALTTGVPVFELKHEGKVYKQVNPQKLWDEIMRSTWDWAEPGVLFLDTMNKKNNLKHLETICATNPCGEQPLPPYGACLLGSFNLVKYFEVEYDSVYSYTGIPKSTSFNYKKLKQDIYHVVRAMDNVINNTVYPLTRQQIEALNKRRMGLGITGFGSLLGLMSIRYGSPESLRLLEEIMKTLRDTAYTTSIALATEKGPYPLFKEIPEGCFLDLMPYDIKNLAKRYGIRNSHLLSIAPTGTISLCADNVSSGIEPVFAKSYERVIQTFDGPTKEVVKDYSVSRGANPTTTSEVSMNEHLEVLALASKYVDSACSKTCNVGPKVTWEDFKDLYENAWKKGCSGITTYRPREGLESVLKEVPEEPEVGAACFIDPETGRRTCE